MRDAKKNSKSRIKDYTVRIFTRERSDLFDLTFKMPRHYASPVTTISGEIRMTIPNSSLKDSGKPYTISWHFEPILLGESMKPK